MGIRLAPVDEIAALKGSDVAEPSRPKVLGDPFGLLPETVSLGLLSWRSQQEIAGPLVHWQQAISAENDLVGSPDGAGGLPP